MKPGLIRVHTFVFNPKDNGGESLSLTTKFMSNGDEKNFVYQQQFLDLQSYSNSATFTLAGATLTPQLLRELANQLESELIKANAK